MEYRMGINSYEPIMTSHSTGDKRVDVLLNVGGVYRVVYSKPSNKKDQTNNGRIVLILGFTGGFMGDVIVKYLDNNRRGRVIMSCLLPCKSHKMNLQIMLNE